MNKWNYVVMAMGTALALSACSDDVDVNGNNGVNAGGTAEQVFMQFSLELPTVSRSVTTSDEDDKYVQETIPVMDFIKIIPGIGQVVKLAESGAKAFGDWKNGKNGPAYNAQVKEPVKKYATGTTFTSGGLSLVGENGPELINLKKGASVISTDKTKELINSSDKNITINLNVNGNVIGNRDFIEEILRLLAIEFRKVMPA